MSDGAADSTSEGELGVELETAGSGRGGDGGLSGLHGGAVRGGHYYRCVYVL